MSQLQDRGDLFRQDVIDAQSRRLHGEVILRQSLPTKIITATIVILVAAAAIWVVAGRYARVETARGMLVPVDGSSKIVALRPGVVAALFVRDGDLVKAGQKLAVIRMETPNAAGRIGTEEELGANSNQTALAREQVGLSAQRSRSDVSRLDGVITGLRQQVVSLDDQIKLQREFVSSATTTFEQIKSVVEKGYVSKLEYERRHQAMLTAQQDLSRLLQQLESTQAQIATTERERTKVELDGANEQASARSALEGFRQQRSRIEGEASYTIEAPVSGRVTGLQTSLGSTVSETLPLMVVIPDGAKLRADLFVPSRAIGFVKPGQEVRLLYDAFPYQRFGSYVAHVDTVSRLAISGQETGAPFRIDEPVYRVSVVLDRQEINAYGRPVALQPGMTLVANLILERQSFLDWVLDPIRAVSNRN